VKLTNISRRQIVSVRRDCDVRRYTHLCPDVLATPPTTYMPTADVYSVGVAMYEMWTGRRAYWDELDASRPAVSGVDEFVAFARSVRRRLDVDDGASSAGDNRRRRAASTWRELMRRCWRDDERISCKALLQLVTAMDRHHGDVDRRLGDADRRLGDVDRHHGDDDAVDRRLGDVDRHHGDMDRRHGDDDAVDDDDMMRLKICDDHFRRVDSN